MQMNVWIIIAYSLIPVLLLYLCHKYPLVDKIGAVVIAYVLGVIIGNIGILPENSNQTLDLISTITIPIAFPLLLFSLDIRSWSKVAGKTFIAMILAIISVVVMVIAGYFWFGPYIDQNWKVAGLLIGVYTGGTPNLASINTALDVDPNTYLLTHTYDIVLGAMYFLILITIGQRILKMVLPPFKKVRGANMLQVVKDAEGIDNYGGMFSKPYFKPLMVALGLSVLIFAAAGGISLLVPENSQMVTVILGITTFGLILSLVPKIHQIEKTFQLGMYFIIVFCLAVSSQADVTLIFNIQFLHLFLYVLLAYFGSLILHVLLSMIFKIDADTVIITSSALLFSPPFVPVVASAIRNKDVIISGLTVGIIGYAIGNYLGVFIAYMLKGWG
jgi:uncharacterized membrane protein